MDTTLFEGKPGAVNMGRVERVIFGAAGAGLLGYAISRRSRWSPAVLFIGGSLLYSGLRGHSFIFQMLSIERGESGRGGVSVEHAVTIYRPLSEVYAYWHNFENLPNFMRHLKSVQVTGPRQSHWVAEAPLGSDIEWDAEITSEGRDEYIAWRTKGDSAIQHSGMVNFRRAPGDRGTEVRVALEYHPIAGSTGAALATLLGEEPDRQIREDLLRFKQVMETGEFATIRGQTSGRDEPDEGR